MSLNKVLLIGNVGKDPEVRHLEIGAVTASFSLATSERYKDRNGEVKDITEWHNIVCWRGLAEIVEKYVKKGTQLYIEGKIRTRSYQDRDGNTRYITEINADDIRFVGRKSDGESNYSGASGYYNGGGYSSPAAPAPAPAVQTPVQKPQANSFNTPVDDIGDDLPF